MNIKYGSLEFNGTKCTDDVTFGDYITARSMEFLFEDTTDFQSPGCLLGLAPIDSAIAPIFVD